MKARILVVDDAATVRMYHRKLLSDAGWQTEEAANGLEALECLQQEAAQGEGFDLVVVDINMPKMDGYRLVQQLRGDAQLPQPPVLMISTEAQSSDKQRALQAGANAYLLKPAQPQALVQLAAMLMGDAQVAHAGLVNAGDL